MAELNQTPSGMRIHIGVFGRTNSGKSSLVNALTGQDVSIVSDEPGTTTDPVYKAIELAPIGPCVLIDTAGLEDETALGQARMERTWAAAELTDIALILTNGAPRDAECRLEKFFHDREVPVLHVDGGREYTEDSLAELRAAIAHAAQAIPEPSILNGSVAKGDLVLLVMPQDRQAPKGRLILPQVATLRELLDNHAMTMCVTPDELEGALSTLPTPPKWIITDSQVFDLVSEKKPPESKLTSFSILYAGMKGDIVAYVDGARAIGGLAPDAHILIAESCSHAPMEEDIGRVKIPNLLRKRIGEGITIDIVAGKDFPDDLTKYQMIIQCGGCMVNRRMILSRIARAQSQGVPITNYGVAIAYLKGILDQVTLPGSAD